MKAVAGGIEEQDGVLGEADLRLQTASLGKPGLWKRITSSDTVVLVLFGLGVVLLYIGTNGRYGFHRDELQTFNKRSPASLRLRGIPTAHRVPWPLGTGNLRDFATRFPVLPRAGPRTGAGPRRSSGPRTRRQARGTTRGCPGSRHRRELAVSGIVSVLYIDRLSVVDRRGLLRNPAPQV